MSFKFNNLVRIASVDGYAKYLYATDDTKATVEGADYFSSQVDMLQVGDGIEVLGDIDGTPFTANYIVATNDGTHVTITEQANVTQAAIIDVCLQKISTKASDAEIFRFVPAFAGSITKAYSVLNAALATADATVQLKINGTNVTNGLMTITQSGSAAGDVDSCTPTAANTFAAGDTITAVVAGGSTGTGTTNVTLQLTPT